MISESAPAKINLALVVGGTRPDGLHELATILQRVELSDTISLEPADKLIVEGFADDSIVQAALEAAARAAGVDPHWHARIDKKIPVAAGLGGGSSDAATAIRLATRLLGDPFGPDELHEMARGLGADVPFFLEPGPKLGTGDGTTLEPLDLPQDYTVLLLLPGGETKPSTGAIYGRFDGEAGFEERRATVIGIAKQGREADLAALPPNDLVWSVYSERLRALGAFRADVSGAGPTVYGLFANREVAEQAVAAIETLGEVWLTSPAW